MIKQLTEAEYSAATGIRSSDLKYPTMAHFKAAVIDKILVRESAAFDLGTCVHAAILEQDTSRFVAGPKFDKRTKDGKAGFESFQKENEGKIILSADDANLVYAMFEKFCAHKTAHKFVSVSKIEQSVFTIHHETGLELKARPDGYFEDNGKLYIWDFKTTRNASAGDFSRQCGMFGYDISAAFYSMVLSQELKKPVEGFFFVGQEKTAPYEVAIFQASKAMLANAAMKVDEVLNRISVAIRENYFPGYPESVQELNLPKWMTRINEEADFAFEVAQ
jgi:exodeoxyribonuclease VIII